LFATHLWVWGCVSGPLCAPSVARAHTAALQALLWVALNSAGHIFGFSCWATLLSSMEVPRSSGMTHGHYTAHVSRVAAARAARVELAQPGGGARARRRRGARRRRVLIRGRAGRGLCGGRGRGRLRGRGARFRVWRRRGAAYARGRPRLGHGPLCKRGLHERRAVLEAGGRGRAPAAARAPYPRPSFCHLRGKQGLGPTDDGLPKTA